jgi:ERCC4-type nuclease
MPLIIDDRDARVHPQIKLDIERNLDRTNVQVDRLDYGDYVFEHTHEVDGKSQTTHVGIELSTVSDVAGKLGSGRLTHQMVGLLKSGVAILMVQGWVKRNEDGTLALYGSPAKVDYTRFTQALFSLQAHGVIVVYSQDSRDSARRIVSIYRWFEKSPSQHKLLREVDAEVGVTVPIGAPIERPIAILMSVTRGLGEERARAALEQYHAVNVIVSLEPKALATIHGWGPKIASDFHKAVSEWH